MISVYSPRGVETKVIDCIDTLLIQDAQRVRFDWLSGPVSKATYIEFWRMEGEIYGKTNGDWPTNTGVGLGDQSQPALSVVVFRAPSFLLENVMDKHE